MKAKGNGKPQQCVANLLRIIRNEVPYDRLKGIDATLYDRPSAEANPMLIADTDWVIETYEPRVDVNSIEVQEEKAKNGIFGLNTDVKIL